MIPNYYDSIEDMIDEQPVLSDKRLTEVTICSSHNSYLKALQCGDSTDVEIVTKLLQVGVRAIELDLFSENATTFKPMVYHGDEEKNIAVTNKISLEEFLYAISNYRKVVKTISDYPLLLFLELNLNNYPYKDENLVVINPKPLNPCSQVANLLKQYFKADILTRTERGIKRPIDFTLGQLKNRVIIFSGGGIQTDDLNDCIAWNTGDVEAYENKAESTLQAIPESEYEAESQKSKLIMRRVYPSLPRGWFSFPMNFRPAVKMGYQIIAENLQSYISPSCFWTINNAGRNYMRLFDSFSAISTEEAKKKLDTLPKYDLNWNSLILLGLLLIIVIVLLIVFL